MAAFEEATGITVTYIGDKEFEGRLSIAVDAGDPPDIADFPQPGLLANFTRQGHVIDPTTFISQDWLNQQYNQSWLDMGTMEGQTAGVWHRYNGKSLVYYPKDDFDAAGYEVPETWDELVALTQLIADDGDPAWCIGIQSGAATGWAATDWTEEMMLRTTSLENYDAWVAGELPFSSPEVKNAIETWSEIWFNPDFVFGGTDAIVSTFFGDSPAPMFEDPPKCWLHRQGNFITGFFPEGAEAGVDFDFFYLPPVDDAYGSPFLVAGDIMSMFNDRPEVRALMEYFTVPQSASIWLANGGALAAHQTTPLEMYSEDLRGVAELAASATSFRFDASDLMPGEVGAGSFWTGMTDYVSGLSDLDTAVQEIDDSWPR
jgi:alpha-glucoside transport system substrate-binding protein